MPPRVPFEGEAPSSYVAMVDYELDEDNRLYLHFDAPVIASTGDFSAFTLLDNHSNTRGPLQLYAIADGVLILQVPGQTFEFGSIEWFNPGDAITFEGGRTLSPEGRFPALD